ncbi:hypothetical protein [Bradyrhizobium archetypum]|uniref:hypothetical protein n=1 Tax=Bradyrhizobium archetypum TaxID=2721160 RepID=UPI001F23AD8E|nr:hypothetical protein [Bradyrhizobium archetypum]
MAPPQKEREDERRSKEGAGDNRVGNDIEPDEFRLPQQARAVLGELRHGKSSKKRLHACNRNPPTSLPDERNYSAFWPPAQAQRWAGEYYRAHLSIGGSMLFPGTSGAKAKIAACSATAASVASITISKQSALTYDSLVSLKRP